MLTQNVFNMVYSGFLFQLLLEKIIGMCFQNDIENCCLTYNKYFRMGKRTFLSNKLLKKST